MQRHEFRHFSRQRVRWVEIDMQKIVFNGHYLTYIDNAMFDYWRSLALPYAESMQRLGGDMYVRKASLEYHASAVLDDRLDVGLKVAHVGNSSLRFVGGIFRNNSLLISAEVIYVFADSATQTSKTIPAELRQLIEAFETGEAISHIQTGHWNDLGRDAGALRKAVFVHEQGFSEEDEWDQYDATAVHAVAYNGLSMPIATGRLVHTAAGHSKIGRIAVEKNLRGGQFGGQIMAALEQAAMNRGDKRVSLHAQVQAQGFYERIGYSSVGDVFDEDGAPHIKMQKELASI